MCLLISVNGRRLFRKIYFLKSLCYNKQKAGVTMQEIFQAINDYAEKYIDFLCEICSFEAKALDKQTIDKMVDYISSFAKA